MNEWHSNVRAGAVGDGLIGDDWGQWWGCFSASQEEMVFPSRMTFGSGEDVWW